MVATLLFVDFHVTTAVITTALPSSNVAVATNCCVSPEVIEAVVGVTSIDFRLASVTESVIVPLMDRHVVGRCDCNPANPARSRARRPERNGCSQPAADTT